MCACIPVSTGLPPMASATAPRLNCGRTSAPVPIPPRPPLAALPQRPARHSGLPPWEWRVEIRASCNCTHSDCLHAGARLNWGAIVDARVQALTIVEDFDVVEHRRLRLLAGVEADLVDVLRLE